MKEELTFEYEGHTYKLDYGLTCVDTEHIWSYGDYIKLQYPEKKWFYHEGGSYQGDWCALGKDEKGFYFHQGSYGSCSGCDWLLGLPDKEDAIDFLKEMKKIIFIGDTWEKAKKYLEDTKKNGLDDLKEAIDEVIKNMEETL